MAKEESQRRIYYDYVLDSIDVHPPADAHTAKEARSSGVESFVEQDILAVFSDCGPSSGGAKEARDKLYDLITKKERNHQIRKREITIGCKEGNDYFLPNATKYLKVIEKRYGELVAQAITEDGSFPSKDDTAARFMYREGKDETQKQVFRERLTEDSEISLDGGKTYFRIPNFLQLALKAINSKMYPCHCYWQELNPDNTPIGQERKCSFEIEDGEKMYIRNDSGILKFLTEAEMQMDKTNIAMCLEKRPDGDFKFTKYDTATGANVAFETQVDAHAKIVPPGQNRPIVLDMPGGMARKYNIRIINPHATATILRIRNLEGKVEIVNTGDNAVFGYSQEYSSWDPLNDPDCMESEGKGIFTNALGRKRDIKVSVTEQELSRYPNMLVTTGVVGETGPDTKLTLDKIGEIVNERINDCKSRQETIAYLAKSTLDRLKDESRTGHRSFGYLVAAPYEFDTATAKKTIQVAVGKMSKFSGLIGASVLSAVAAGGLGYGYARVTQPDRVNHAEESARQAKDEFEKERAGRAEDKKQYQAAKVPLEKRINELETNNGSLAAQLDEAKKQVLARDKTIEEYNKGEATAKLQAQIKEYEANISGLKAQYETSKKAEEALQAKVAELSAQPVQTAESDAQLAEARKQAEAREEENKKLKEQVTVLTREVTEARSQLQKYETGAPGIAAAQKGPEIGEIILFSDEPFEKPEQEDKKLPDVGEIIW